MVATELLRNRKKEVGFLAVVLAIISLIISGSGFLQANIIEDVDPGTTEENLYPYIWNDRYSNPVENSPVTLYFEAVVKFDNIYYYEDYSEWITVEYNSGGSWTEISFSYDGSGDYSAEIPGFPEGTAVDYRINFYIDSDSQGGKSGSYEVIPSKESIDIESSTKVYMRDASGDWTEMPSGSTLSGEIKLEVIVNKGFDIAKDVYIEVTGDATDTIALANVRDDSGNPTNVWESVYDTSENLPNGNYQFTTYIKDSYKWDHQMSSFGVSFEGSEEGTVTINPLLFLIPILFMSVVVYLWKFRG